VQLSIGHRITDHTALPYSSDGLVEQYLNPKYQPGCTRHKDPDCLCDVEITEPVPLVRVPPMFLNVDTPEDLLRAAACIWVELDLRDQTSQTAAPEWVESVSDNDLGKIVELARAGRTHDQIEAIIGIKVDKDSYTLIRRAVGASHLEGTAAESTLLIIELGRQGMTAPEISKAVVERLGKHIAPAGCGKTYNKWTGEFLPRAPRQTGRQAFPAERILELFHSGIKTPAAICHALATEGLSAQERSVGRMLQRKGLLQVKRRKQAA
jgi:hypothetical protein